MLWDVDIKPPAAYFDERKEEFFGILRKDLPNALLKIISEDSTEEEYYEKLTFILHLMQEGRLFVKKRQDKGDSIPLLYIYEDKEV